MRLQEQQGLTVNVQVDDNLTGIDHEIERLVTLTGEEARAFVPVRPLPPEPEDDLDLVDEDEEEDEDEIPDDEDEAEVEAEDTDDDEASARAARPARDLFAFSLLYLFGLFAALLVERTPLIAGLGLRL